MPSPSSAVGSHASRTFYILRCAAAELPRQKRRKQEPPPWLPPKQVELFISLPSLPPHNFNFILADFVVTCIFMLVCVGRGLGVISKTNSLIQTDKSSRFNDCEKCDLNVNKLIFWCSTSLFFMNVFISLWFYWKPLFRDVVRHLPKQQSQKHIVYLEWWIDLIKPLQMYTVLYLTSLVNANITPESCSKAHLLDTYSSILLKLVHSQ